MIQVNSLAKAYGDQLLFSDATFSLTPRERVGIVGRNGEGKTTLFRIISGEEQPDTGHLRIPKDYTIGYLSQHISFTQPTVLKEGCASLPHNDDGWEETYKVEAILEGLGFSRAMLDEAPQRISGGFQVRLMLAKVLIAEPNLLLLDEPTNYLDITSVRWLRTFLISWHGELMLITHDRDFMDSVCTHTLGIHRKQLRKIAGPTAKLYEQILLEEEVYEQTRLKEEKRREQSERFINRFRAQASRARAVQSRIKSLSKRERLDELADIQKLEFSFNAAPAPGKWLMHAAHLSFGFTPQSPKLITNLTFSIAKTDRIGIIGPNGRGKTTLLNLLAGELSSSEGTISYNQNTCLGYFGQTNIDRLDRDKTIEQELMNTNPALGRGAVRNICGCMMFEGDNALKKIKVLSGGERSRVLLGKLLVKPANLLLLDEPTNHLDMESIDSLLEALNAFAGGVMIVTHSEMILRALANRLIVFDRGTTTVFEGGYDEFLRRSGWESEGIALEPPETTLPLLPTLSKKEKRARRASIITERSKVLSPLKATISQLEQRISGKEESLKQDNELLQSAIAASDSRRITDLSLTIHSHKQEIDRLFACLEETTKKLQEEQARFDAELAALGD